MTQEALVGADRIIRSLPEVQYTSYAAGFNMLAGIAETDSGVVFVKLVDYSDRKRSAMQIAAVLNGMLYEGLPRPRASPSTRRRFRVWASRRACRPLHRIWKGAVRLT